MKTTLFILTLLLFLGCDNKKEKKNDNYGNNTTPEKKYDDNVNKNSEPPYYIAYKEDQNGTVYITDSDQDIDRLIVDLRPLGVEVGLLERDYWKDQKCRRMSAKKCAAGNCVVGSCTLTNIGGWNVCRCQ